MIKCFNNFVPINIFKNNINEEDLYLLIEEKVNDKNY